MKINVDLHPDEVQEQSNTMPLQNATPPHQPHNDTTHNHQPFMC